MFSVDSVVVVVAALVHYLYY